MTIATKALPHWDMTVFFPALESPEFAEAYNGIVQSIGELDELFAKYDIRERTDAPSNDHAVAAFDDVAARLNTLLDAVRLAATYVSGQVSTNSRDTVAQAKLSELQGALVELSKLSTRFTAWIGSLDVEALIAGSPLAAEHAYMLRKDKIESEHLMSPSEEDLATELNLVGGNAWGRLHNNVTSQLSVTVEQDGERRDLPMSMVRNLAFDPSRDVRKNAYEAELAAWEKTAVPLAAAMNSIKGEVNNLSQRRGWQAPLDVALFDANIDRQTLAAMQEACTAAFPDFRRYLKAKARLLGLPALAWYDMFAPVGENNRVWEYEEASDFIVTQFGSYSERMGEFAARAFRENWIDAEPRPGKRDGAYCMGVKGDVSRVFANFKPTFPGLSTLAHELGHAYHNLNLANRTALQRNTPMTLAETASIFCETIIRNAGLKNSDEAEQLVILEASLQGSTQVVVDIMSRFLFESRVFEKRQARELSVPEFNELMLQAQRETYGDGLDEKDLHPYMWAVKNHYYSTGRSFYNFPYTFGLLFGQGLYAQYQQDPETFKRGYDDLLSSTGLADAAELAGRFGFDITKPDFWHASLATIRDDIDLFEKLVGA